MTQADLDAARPHLTQLDLSLVSYLRAKPDELHIKQLHAREFRSRLQRLNKLADQLGDEVYALTYPNK